MSTPQRARMSLGARIALAVAAAVLVLVAGILGVNLSAAVTFNQATTSLNANIKAAQDESTDMDTLNAQQQQTDAQFADANSMRTLLLPQIKDAIDANADVSAQLTKITLKKVEAQRNGTDEQNSNQQNMNTSNGKAKTGGILTDEQKKQVEELMKANQQSTDTQANTDTSKQKAEQNTGTGASKPW